MDYIEERQESSKITPKVPKYSKFRIKMTITLKLARFLDIHHLQEIYNNLTLPYFFLLNLDIKVNEHCL